MSAPLDDPLIGQQLANFRLERLLGSGGMAQVYYGWDVKLERPVAVKVIDARFRSNRDYAERFVREARAVATWRHENITRVYHAGEEHGLYYFAMEYIDGRDVASLLRQHREAGELMPHPEALRIGMAVARALDYAHRKGVIHRDVKPANVLVADDGRVVLTDFGLAMEVEEGSLGQVFGSPLYIAPEQARHSADAVPASDQYSLGVMFYEMLTGVVPFDDPSPTSVALQHIMQPPPPPSQFNPELGAPAEAVLLRALAKAPEERYGSCVELVEALEQTIEAPGAAGGPIPSAGEEAPAAAPRRPLPPIPAAVARRASAEGEAAPPGAVSPPGAEKTAPPGAVSPPGAEKTARTGAVSSPGAEKAAPPGAVSPPAAEKTAPTVAVSPPAVEKPRPAARAAKPGSARPTRDGVRTGLTVAGLLGAGFLGMLVMIALVFLFRGSLLADLVGRPVPTTGGGETPVATAATTSRPGPSAALPGASPTAGRVVPTQVATPVPTATPAPVSPLLFVWQSSDKLFVANRSGVPVLLSPLRLSDGKGAVQGSDWNLLFLLPGDCAGVWQDRGGGEAPKELQCRLTGSHVVRDKKEEIWRTELSVYYEDKQVATCSADQEQGCPVQLPEQAPRWTLFFPEVLISGRP